MEELRLRIRTLLMIKGYTPNKLANGNSALQNRLSRQLRSAAITADTLITCLDTFPDVSAEWLLRGEGDMIKSDVRVINNTYNKAGGDGDGQTNVIGNENAVSDKEILRMALEQNQQLINKLLNEK